MKLSLFVQLRRYVTVGIGSAITDLCVYAWLTRSMGYDPLVANLISRPMGGVFSFVCNKLYTLRVPSSACHDCSECLPCKVLS